MRIRKSLLRECARRALEERGFTVELVSGAGIVPGARLRTFKGAEERLIAVRTSLDREVGLTRHSDGRWAIIPRVDEVIVAVPSSDGSDSVEVLSFSPGTIIHVFDAVLEDRKKQNPDFLEKSPIFVALDIGRDAADPGLKAKAQWQAVIPLAEVPRRRPTEAVSTTAFIERVRQEFADLHGLDVDKVTVEFRIRS
jgi:hypothetical protein